MNDVLEIEILLLGQEIVEEVLWQIKFREDVQPEVEVPLPEVMQTDVLQVMDVSPEVQAVHVTEVVLQLHKPVEAALHEVLLPVEQLPDILHVE